MDVKNRLQIALQEACVKAWGKQAEVQLELCKDPRHGDLSSNVAMQLARDLQKPPRDVAEPILEHLNSPDVQTAVIAGPGFLNFNLKPKALHSVFEQPFQAPKTTAWTGKRVNVEFVSANPTGPLTLGNGRLASVGDTLAACFAFLGAQAEREYYINDHGRQVDMLSESVLAKLRVLKGLPENFPEDGYRGDYVEQLAKSFLEDHPEAAPGSSGPESLTKQISEYAINRMVTGQKEHLGKFGVHYTTWFSEQTLHGGDGSKVAQSLAALKANGATEDREGALWFLSTKYSDEKDRVLVRGGGVPTYFAADVAYHHDKFQRGYDLMIDLWGADHHGYIQRVKSAMTALGHDAEKLQICICQMVQLKREDNLVRMSKRKGNIVTLEHLMEEVPVDVCRWFFLMRSIDSTLDFDLELARDTSEKNPVYYVQYAHARIHSILRKAEQPAEGKLDITLLDEEERLIALKLLELEVVVERAVQRCAVHLLTSYAHELASAFHGYYSKKKILTGDDTQITRLMVVRRVQEALGMVLKLAGVDAPESM